MICLNFFAGFIEFKLMLMGPDLGSGDKVRFTTLILVCIGLIGIGVTLSLRSSKLRFTILMRSIVMVIVLFLIVLQREIELHTFIPTCFDIRHIKHSGQILFIFSRNTVLNNHSLIKIHVE